MMNTIYPNEGAQLPVIGAEAKPGTSMEGLLLSNLGFVFLQVARLLLQSYQAGNPTKIWNYYRC